MNEPKGPPLKRRAVFATAGAAGALAGVAALAPRVPPQVVGSAEAKPKPDAAGYQESAHVLRYYQTTRV